MSRLPLRIVGHAILRIDLIPAQMRELEATNCRRCQVDAKGHAAPNIAPGQRTRGDVLKLLREARSSQTETPRDEPNGTSSAIL